MSDNSKKRTSVSQILGTELKDSTGIYLDIVENYITFPHGRVNALPNKSTYFFQG